MPISNQPTGERFTLTAGSLGAYLRREHGERLGLDEFHEPGGLAGSIAERLRDADDAGAIRGPEEFVVSVAGCLDGDLIVLVNNGKLWAARAPIHSKQIPHAHSGGFEECCLTLQWLLDQASPLIVQLRAAAAPPDRDSGTSLLGRVARELLVETVKEERAQQPVDARASEEQLERHLATVSEQLAVALRSTVTAFNCTRPLLSGAVASEIAPGREQ